MQTRVLAAVGLAAVTLVACSPKEAAKPKADASALANLPKPKAGLWEQTTTVGGGTLTNRVCLDDNVSAQLAGRSGNPPGSTCAAPSVDKAADGSIKITATCDLQGGGKLTSTSTETGDLQSAYTTVVELNVTGSPTASTNGTIKRSVSSKLTGPCPQGWQPGDVELANGQKLNLLHPAPAKPAG